MIIQNTSKVLIFLFISLLSVNSDSRKPNESSSSNKVYLKTQYLKGKPINKYSGREYPMAPTAEELNGEAKDFNEPASYNPGSIVIPIEEGGSIAESQGSPYIQNQLDKTSTAYPESHNSFVDMFSSIMDPNFNVQTFIEIIIKFVQSILPKFSDASSFATGLASAMSSMNVPPQVCNGVAGQCLKYFEQMKNNPDSIGPIMTKVLNKTFNRLRKKYENTQKMHKKQRKPNKLRKVNQKKTQKKTQKKPRKQHGQL